MGEVLGFDLGLTGLFVLAREPAQLMVGVLLAIFSFRIGFDPLIKVNVALLLDRSNVLSEAIAFSLEPVQDSEVAGDPLEFWELVEIENNRISQNFFRFRVRWRESWAGGGSEFLHRKADPRQGWVSKGWTNDKRAIAYLQLERAIACNQIDLEGKNFIVQIFRDQDYPVAIAVAQRHFAKAQSFSILFPAVN